MLPNVLPHTVDCSERKRNETTGGVCCATRPNLQRCQGADWKMHSIYVKYFQNMKLNSLKHSSHSLLVPVFGYLHSSHIRERVWKWNDAVYVFYRYLTFLGLEYGSCIAIYGGSESSQISSNICDPGPQNLNVNFSKLRFIHHLKAE